MVHLSVEGREKAVETFFDRMNRRAIMIDILIDSGNESRMNAFFVRYVLTGCVLARSIDGRGNCVNAETGLT